MQFAAMCRRLIGLSAFKRVVVGPDHCYVNQQACRPIVEGQLSKVGALGRASHRFG